MKYPGASLFLVLSMNESSLGQAEGCRKYMGGQNQLDGGCSDFSWNFKTRLSDSISGTPVFFNF